VNGRRVVQRVGRIHDVSHDRIAVPTTFVRRGDNVFSIASSTEHHAAEVNWPGPALLIEYPMGPRNAPKDCEREERGDAGSEVGRTGGEVRGVRGG
jgi:hypothetical protein